MKDNSKLIHCHVEKLFKLLSQRDDNLVKINALKFWIKAHGNVEAKCEIIYSTQAKTLLLLVFTCLSGKCIHLCSLPQKT